MDLKPQKNQELKNYTTLQIGGEADFLVTVKDESELKAALQFARQQTATPPLILGGGSNVLCSDDGYRGLVIKMEIKGIKYTKEADYTLVTAGAGELWDEFVLSTIEHDLSGLENLSGIPGTVGAAPIQNINAYGTEVASRIHSVSTINIKTMETQELTADDCLFGYRDSIFKQPEGRDLVVTAVTFKLSPLNSAVLTYRSSSQSIARYLEENGVTDPTPRDVRDAVLFARKNIGMLLGQFRSAGSFFKNVIVSKNKFKDILAIVESDFKEQNENLSPWYWELPGGQMKIATAFILECSPYNKKTYGEKRINGVGISPKHSLSIVTEPGATAADVEHFISLITEYVQDTFSITLEREVLRV